MNYSDLLKECGFMDVANTAINVHTQNFDYNLAFIEAETKEELCIMVTDELGREKLRILNKNHVESVEVVYQDDISFEDKEEPSNKMYV